MSVKSAALALLDGIPLNRIDGFDPAVLQRFAEENAPSAVQVADDVIAVNFGNLITPPMILVYAAVQLCVEATHDPIEAVVFDLRQYVERNLSA